MRLFLAGLLIVNIVFATWYWYLKEPVSGQASSVDAGVERLLLVSEQTEAAQADNVAQINGDDATETDDMQASEQSVTQKKQQTRPTEPLCYVMSLFDARQEAGIAASRLQALGYSAKLTIYYSPKSKYVVYLPSFPSLADARKVTEQLKKMGQTDYQILDIQDQKNSISLGVYSQFETAEVRRKEIDALGYSALVTPIYRTPLGYRVEFNNKDKVAMTDAEKGLLLKSFKNVTIEPLKCGS